MKSTDVQHTHTINVWTQYKTINQQKCTETVIFEMAKRVQLHSVDYRRQ